MATTYACPFADSCDTACSEAEVGEYLRVAAESRSRQLLSVLRSHVGEDLGFEYVLDQLPTAGEEQRRDRAMDLRHVTLPKLKDLGIVEYDRDESSVRYLGCSLVAEPIELVEVT